MISSERYFVAVGAKGPITFPKSVQDVLGNMYLFL